MNRYLFLIVLGVVAVISIGALALGGGNIVLFHPKGVISAQEAALMLTALRLMLLVVVPVFVLTGAIAWRYRASNTSARYLPNWEHNATEEIIWWTVPFIIIAVLAVITWQSAHALDPYRPIVSNAAPLEVDVVSLDWKWLFIYPAQGIATVNYLEIPVGTPVAFKLTSDAPMNALWIPQLAGQEMAMPGMVTQLHIEADTAGEYRGLSSNYSGEGFAGMSFPVYATSTDAFGAWVAQVQQSQSALTVAAYRQLAQPSMNVPPAFYTLGDANLYTGIVMQYMMPGMSLASSTPAAAASTSMTAMPVKAVPMQMPDMPGMHM